MKKLFVLVLTLTLSACATPTPAMPSPQPPTPTSQSPAPSPQSPTSAPQLPTPSPQPPTPTPEPKIKFTQLTQGGCCVQPSFSPDGARALYLDKPSANAQTGIYAVPINQPLSQPQFVIAHPGPFSADMRYAEDLIGGRTVITRLADGVAWVIPSGGRRASFSPDATRITWSVGEETGGFDVRKNDIYVADVDGKNAKLIATRYGGGVMAWMPDSKQILLGGKEKRADKLAKIGVMDLATGAVRPLFEAERLRNTLLSPDGKWLVYLLTASENGAGGTFVIPLDGSSAAPRQLDIFGAFQWRDGSHLLYIPLKVNAPSSELWQIDAQTGAMTQLIAAAPDSPFKIGGGDWDVSPDGNSILYLNARDRNIWVASLR